jgi:hypothetical protein
MAEISAYIFTFRLLQLPSTVREQKVSTICNFGTPFIGGSFTFFAWKLFSLDYYYSYRSIVHPLSWYLQILIILLLIFGNLRASMNHNDFISSLSGLGVIGAIHMFSWLVVFQFRKNLMEEQHIMARMVASAPTPPNGTTYLKNSFTIST